MKDVFQQIPVFFEFIVSRPRKHNETDRRLVLYYSNTILLINEELHYIFR